MAPALSVVLGAELAGSGVIVLANGQLALVGILTAVSAFLLLSLLLMLCASCQGQKKANGHPGDHETLMNGVSEKEVCSQSVESQGTDLAASSSHNGPLTSGTVLSDTIDTSPQPSEEMLSIQSELRSSKCPQDRELPSIPSGGVGGGGPPSLNGPPTMHMTSDHPSAPDDGEGIGGAEGTYETVCGGGVSSRDVSAEDSLYETVKGDVGLGATLTNGVLSSPDDECGGEPTRRISSYQDPPSVPPQANGVLLNGHLTPTPSPPTPERGPLVAGVEYASIDLNKKSRYSADMEARRRSTPATTPDPRKQKQEEEEEEEDKPPPIPDKVLDENDNQHTISNIMMPHNGQLPSPVGSSLPEDHVTLENELYSSVLRQRGEAGDLEGRLCDLEEDKEGDYSSIGDLRCLGTTESESESVTNDLYACVKDIYADDPRGTPCGGGGGSGGDMNGDLGDPGYETIRIPKGAEHHHHHHNGQSDASVQPVEPDYESVAELGLSRDLSRL
ncbi:phosphoprotein associated with glycosphingolipid-enriched microdomains 1 isoform X2 [Engraulis encrasicolus]|uniref:phosphoprotein associated with glycosphingolipid-enriched microdomains 1 isoform X2 n=1 Tax=Engraulis encrasicolus TaxID=184585 RepID=UPI002FD26990